MTKCAQKNKFIVPFTQLDRNAAPPIVNGKQTRPYTHGEWSPVHIERDEWSPVHIGRDIQSVTPSTKKKIKQRLAYGFASQRTRKHTPDVSPGIVVPVEFSQISCASDIIDNESVVCGNVAEVNTVINAEQHDEKLTSDENTNEVIELEIEYQNEPSKDITGENHFDLHPQIHHYGNKHDDNASLLPENKVELKKTNTVTDANLDSTISCNYTTDCQFDISYESSNGSRRKKHKLREQTNAIQINQTSDTTRKTAVDNVKQQPTDEKSKFISTIPNTEDKALEVVDLLLQNNKRLGKQLKKIKVTHSNNVPNNKKKRSCRKTATTIKPQDVPRTRQHQDNNIAPQTMACGARKLSSNHQTRRKCTKQSDNIKRDVLKTMLKLHKEIVALQRRRRHLMIAEPSRSGKGHRMSAPGGE